MTKEETVCKAGDHYNARPRFLYHGVTHRNSDKIFAEVEVGKLILYR